jgi:hypothetical protein
MKIKNQSSRECDFEQIVIRSQKPSSGRWRRKTIGMVGLLILCLTLAPQNLARGQYISTNNLDAGFDHLSEQMDQWHRSYNVYTDVGAAGNHFASLAKIASDFGAMDIDLCSGDNPHSGLTSIKSTFRNTTGTNFGGWYFLNGVLTGAEDQPRANFGDVPGAGIDLRGAGRLSFWARADRPGVKVEFFMGGVGRDPFTGTPNMPFPDSTPRLPAIGTVFTLSTDWAPYSIDINGADLSYILGGFAFVFSASSNPQGAVIWVDDITYDKSRLDEPRFIQSYVTITGQAFDNAQRNLALTIDNAMAMLAYMSRGNEDDWRRAELLAKAFEYAQGHDVAFSDGRLRNGYQAGDLILPVGWTPNNKTGAARLPVIADCAAGRTITDRFQLSSYTNSVAMAMIALLTFYQKKGGSQYLEAARKMGEWIEGRRQNAGLGGYKGGFEGFDRPSAQNPNDPVEVSWTSSEHVFDVFVACARMFEITGEPVWQERAAHARSYLDKVWDRTTGCFLAGTKDANSLDRDLLPLDGQLRSVLALADALTAFNSALECAETYHKTSKDGFTGYDFNDDRDGISFEKSAEMAAAFSIARRPDRASDILNQLRNAQATGTNGNGRGMVEASHDGVTTGYFSPTRERQLLYSRLHTGSSAWYLIAESGKNPLNLFGTRGPRISNLQTMGKQLIVSGANFDNGARVLINNNVQKKTFNDPDNLTTRLVCQKAGKQIRPGDKVKVRNTDGTESDEFTYQG